jgi:hypothetical protein
MKKAIKVVSIKRLWIEMVIVVAVIAGLAQGSVFLKAGNENVQLAINHCESGIGIHGDLCCCLVE